MTISDLYQLLFGKNHIQDGNVIDMAEHGRVGGASTGQPFKMTSVIDAQDGTSLTALISTLQELNQRLAPLAGAMSPTAQIRAVVTGAVTATGGGYITSAQAIAALLTQTNTLWINNLTAINSNINNVVVTN